ncbi:MAG: YciI family protein [Bacteroidota bacterium]
MFLIDVTYKVELEKIDQFLKVHIAFLDEQYALGNFLASGRKVPRTGGMILANMEDQTALESIIEKDPFKQNGLADYKLIQFSLNKACEELTFLIGK